MFYSFIKLVFDRALCINVILFATRQHARSANATRCAADCMAGKQAQLAAAVDLQTTWMIWMNLSMLMMILTEDFH